MAELDAWLIANYEAIVADKNRFESYESIAAVAEQKNAPDLAAWARSKAAKKKDVTPTAAVADVPKAKR